jgi:nucleotide-binding universal stress UspA family protein
MFSPSAVLVNSLARHDVNVSLMQAHAGRADIGAEILYSIKDKGANLLVMGAYGSSRIRELLFGGVTKEILDQIDIPVLLSH